jgi:aminoglycoside N3'-acetyltransferase
MPSVSRSPPSKTSTRSGKVPFAARPTPQLPPPVPESWQELIRENVPAFDPRTMPSCGVGRISETFRAWLGALRSSHPAVSFAARGRHAIFVAGEQSLDYPLGEGSPLAWIYELDGQVLLLGVGHQSNTSFRTNVRTERGYHGGLDEAAFLWILS